MTTNDLKWLQMSLYVSNKLTEVIWSHLRSFGVIWDHLESFKSWGDKISYTINIQRLLSFFCGVSETVACSLSGLKRLSDAYGFNSFRGLSSPYSEITYECPCNCTNSSAIWGLINSQNVQGKKDFLKLQWIALIICFFFTFFHLYFKENADNTSNTACICCILWEIMPWPHLINPVV